MVTLKHSTHLFSVAGFFKDKAGAIVAHTKMQFKLKEKEVTMALTCLHLFSLLGRGNLT